MKRDKAEEYFSAYYEGELDAGLKQQFERLLKDDGEVAGKYAEFTSTMDLLGAMDQSEIVFPAEVGEKISARLDHHFWEQKQVAKPSFFSNWRLALVGGIASIAVIATVAAIISPGNGGPSQAGFIRTNQAPVLLVPEAKLVMVDGDLALSIESNGKAEVVISDFESGEQIDAFELSNENASNPLTNSAVGSRVLKVTMGSGATDLVAVLPGTTKGTSVTGNGSALDFAKALAGTFRTPLELRLKDVERAVQWDLPADATLEQMQAAASDAGLTLALREDSFLVLSD